jgi:hypothetical protein
LGDFAWVSHAASVGRRSPPGPENGRFWTESSTGGCLLFVTPAWTPGRRAPIRRPDPVARAGLQSARSFDWNLCPVAGGERSRRRGPDREQMGGVDETR